jgi:hypothetical protein
VHQLPTRQVLHRGAGRTRWSLLAGPLLSHAVRLCGRGTVPSWDLPQSDGGAGTRGLPRLPTRPLLPRSVCGSDGLSCG